MGGEMTKCVTLNRAVINVGPWEDGREEVFTIDHLPLGAVIVDGFWIKNPLPQGAIEEDIPLAWTDDERIVRGDDPRAARPFA